MTGSEKTDITSNIDIDWLESFNIQPRLRWSVIFSVQFEMKARGKIITVVASV